MNDYDIDEIEQLGVNDGVYDKDNHMSYQASFGSSIDLDELTDEQREAYELGYEFGAENYDLNIDDNEDNW